MQVVLDTNVLVSAIGWESSCRQVIEKCLEKRIRLIFSLETLHELYEVLNRKKFRLKKEDINSFVSLLLTNSEIIETKNKIDIVKEDDFDNRFIENAIESDCKYIVSGDKHLLKIKEYKGIEIIKPKIFLKKLEK